MGAKIERVMLVYVVQDVRFCDKHGIGSKTQSYVKP